MRSPQFLEPGVVGSSLCLGTATAQIDLERFCNAADATLSCFRIDNGPGAVVIPKSALFAGV